MRCKRCNGSFEIAWNESAAPRDSGPRRRPVLRGENGELAARRRPRAGAVAWSTYPGPDALMTRSPNSAMPLTGAMLKLPESRPPTGFTLMLMVMLPAKAESGMPRLSRTCT